MDPADAVEIAQAPPRRRAAPTWAAPTWAAPTWAAPAAGLLALLAVSLLLHLALATGQARATAAIAGALDTLATALIVTRHAARPLRCLAAAAALALVLALAQRGPAPGLIAAAGVPHALAYLGLFILFAGSLRPGRTALVSAMARRIHGPLSPAMAAYTRRVTIAWCAFFAAQLLGSLALLLCAPASLWSLFVNVLNLPLVALMFAAEYAWRRHRFPDRPRIAPAALLHALRHATDAG